MENSATNVERNAINDSSITASEALQTILRVKHISECNDKHKVDVRCMWLNLDRLLVNVEGFRFSTYRCVL